MLSRRIILGITSIPLAACVLCWIGSYFLYFSFTQMCITPRSASIDINDGTFSVSWDERGPAWRSYQRAWSLTRNTHQLGYNIDYLKQQHFYHIGFLCIWDPDEKAAVIPFWLPTTLSAAMLWLVRRKGRPHPAGFPVEAQSPQTALPTTDKRTTDPTTDH